MTEQSTDLLSDTLCYSVSNSPNILGNSPKQTIDSEESPRFTEKDVTSIRDSTPNQEKKYQPDVGKAKFNSKATCSQVVNKPKLKLNFQNSKVATGQFGNLSHLKTQDKLPSLIQDCPGMLIQPRQASASHVISNTCVEDAQRKQFAQMKIIPKVNEVKKGPKHPTGLKYKPKFIAEIKDGVPMNETILNSQPISKYEDMIQRFTGKLKMTRDDNSEIPISENDIELRGEIGEGVSGTVYIVEHKASKLQMAAKKMKWKPHLEEQKRILMDLQIMAMQNSNYIVVYYGSLVSKDNVWLYMELMDTCFDKIIHNYGPLPEDILGKLVVSTLNALHYLKSVHDIIHRDVKPSNILINKNGQIKMCDFGISKQLVESCAQTRGAGPTAYISPERLDIDLKEYDVRADVWSLGITVIELLTGKLPYSQCQSDIEVMSKIFQDPPPRLPELITVSKDCRHFIEICLTKDYLKRPKFQELLESCEFVRIYLTKEVQVANWYSTLISY